MEHESNNETDIQILNPNVSEQHDDANEQVINNVHSNNEEMWLSAIRYYFIKQTLLLNLPRNVSESIVNSANALTNSLISNVLDYLKVNIPISDNINDYFQQITHLFDDYNTDYSYLIVVQMIL